MREKANPSKRPRASILPVFLPFHNSMVFCRKLNSTIVWVLLLCQRSRVEKLCRAVCCSLDCSITATLHPGILLSDGVITLLFHRMVSMVSHPNGNNSPKRESALMPNLMHGIYMAHLVSSAFLASHFWAPPHFLPHRSSLQTQQAVDFEI